MRKLEPIIRVCQIHSEVCRPRARAMAMPYDPNNTMTLERLRPLVDSSRAFLDKVGRKLDETGERIMLQAVKELGFSPATREQIIDIARSIAALEEDPNIKTHHVAEAVQYRRLDRK
jgi:magnesium chelatase family protein